MTREEMLNRMGLTSEEFKDLMLKLAQLRASLNDRHRSFAPHAFHGSQNIRRRRDCRGFTKAFEG
jgi:hypothetical protein